MGNGLFAILLINFCLFVGSNLMHLPALSNLALNHWAPQWWQVGSGWGPTIGLLHNWGGACPQSKCLPTVQVVVGRCLGCQTVWCCAELRRRPCPAQQSSTCRIPALQFCTAIFAHANWEHLSSNAFALLVFGRMVEEEEGALGLWLTYLLAGVGGTLASYLTAPHTHTISLGASGGVFGLFLVSG